MKQYFDPRKMDPEGLPVCGTGESLFHASFEMDGKIIEGVVAAKNGSEACSLLAAEEARRLFTTYNDLIRSAEGPTFGRLSREQAKELMLKVPHRVSIWKYIAPEAEPSTGQQVMDLEKTAAGETPAMTF